MHVPQPGLADLIGLAVDEIAHWGADVDRVQRRLGVMLRDLHAAALPVHRETVEQALESFSGGGATLQPRRVPEPTDDGLR